MSGQLLEVLVRGSQSGQRNQGSRIERHAGA